MESGSNKWLVIAIAKILTAAFVVPAHAQSEEELTQPYVPLSEIGFSSDTDFTGPRQPNLLPDNEIFRFETRDKFYDKRKYSNDFRMKGIEISPNVYFGEAKIAGEKGPGIVVEQGDWFWGFNHQGAEILLKF